ncbi:hypothetical protein Q669_20345 [Labrenzia sp. C1B10]|uniref:hypothetical protein n=1 Tax=Labrenzia sp. C1B10 TaxID=1397530 RepID=UPI0003B89BDB|nr:hypothetical protein [Labrenzia sp. C1B10]ERP98656.1 hypothetical protein Q669_20345 [Labrenzia sp. C1B10]ERR00162.1 hypothetical protein Q675_11420 [Labrenzia sp. C1B70]
MEYEQLGVDAVLFGSYGIPESFQVALSAHAAINCIWISAATSAQEALKGPAGIIGPYRKWSSRSLEAEATCFTITVLDRNDPAYEIPLQKARRWLAEARLGDIYREEMVLDGRNKNRSDY